MIKPNFNTLLATKVPATKPCGQCKGTKIDNHVWHYFPDNPKASYHGPGPCEECKESGITACPDFDAIFDAVVKQPKNGKMSLRSSKPKLENEWKNLNEGRIYFVWRMIRFHGGIDVTMPVCATAALHHDPYFDELEQFASCLAKAFCGTDMAAAYRWLGALGHNVTVPDNQPATAYPCGPVVTDNNKPLQEQPELT